jgi:hypothetical protein
MSDEILSSLLEHVTRMDDDLLALTVVIARLEQASIKVLAELQAMRGTDPIGDKSGNGDVK